jgi:predicted membrane protein
MAMTCFVLQFWRMIPGSSVRWRYPSWFENPLALRQPLQWGLLIGEALMLSGAGCAFVDALAFPQQCNWEIPMAVGAGVWLGTYLFGELWVANARR